MHRELLHHEVPDNLYGVSHFVGTRRARLPTDVQARLDRFSEETEEYRVVAVHPNATGLDAGEWLRTELEDFAELEPLP